MYLQKYIRFTGLVATVAVKLNVGAEMGCGDFLKPLSKAESWF
jgi:hypothetical protein